jgi:flagellar motor switch/type III secretory pathway protein FliN
MAEFTAKIVDQVVAACQQGCGEAGGAFSRALDAQLTVTVGQPGTLRAKELPEGIGGPGLAVVLTVGKTGALVLLPESSGLLPSWCHEPDATGQSKLATLAQELGMLLLPEEFMPDDFKASWLRSLTGAIARGVVVDGSPFVPLALTSAEGRHGTAIVVWPAANPAAVIGAGTAAGGKPAAPAAASPTPASTPASTPAPTPASTPASTPAPARKPASSTLPPLVPRPGRRASSVADLPGYSRSLLRIKVPVVVTLARNRQPLGRIVELGPGSIIHFDKPCDGTLDLEIGNHAIAAGEAVKVGDKFGLRITSIVLPEERFKPVLPKR